MIFNISRLGSRTFRRTLGLVLLFGAVLSLVILLSRPSDSQNPTMVSQNPIAPAAQSPIECLEAPSAQTVSTISLDDLAIGTNIASIRGWSSQLPFLDAFKSSRKWVTQCDRNAPGCTGEWSTNEFDQLDLDEHGWVRSLPAPEDPPKYTQVVTLMLDGIAGRYPGGQYVVLYEGEGTIEYAFDAEKDEALSKPGRDVLNVTPSNAGIQLKITATDPNKTGNYIRNIHVVPIAYETTFQTEIFNPVFIDRIKKFKAIRFMDWMDTNDSEQSEWENRPKVDDASYGWGEGVPIEIMITLANRLGANAWFNMPHLATDDYMTKFAQSVKACLDPRLKAYVEFSNEVWNWQFEQAQYALRQGRARWGDKGDAYMQWYGMRTAQMSDIWKQVFGEERDRVVSVISTQTAQSGLEESALDCPLWVAEGNQPCYQHGIDVFAVAGYFSGKLGQDDSVDIVKSWLNDPDGGVSKAFTQIREGSLIVNERFDNTLPGTVERFQYHQKVAQDRGLRLVAYEGGQHLVRPDDEALTEFFIELNRHPEMYNLYTELLNSWKDAGGTLFMNFSDIYEPNKWGSWGVLEYVDQDSSPKYDALMDFIDQHS